MTDGEARALVAALAAAWPRQPIGQPTLDIYATHLQDLDFGQATQVVSGIIRSSRFFPAIAEIREAYAETQLGLPSPSEAWAQACNYGTRHPLVDKARQRVTDDWGWNQGREQDLRRAFMPAYRELRAAEVGRIAHPEIPGLPALEAAS